MATRELHSSPSMAALFARAGAAMIPGASQLPFVGGGGREVPELTLRLTDVEVDGDRRRRLRPGVRIRRCGTGPPAHVSAHARLPAAALADDRPELSVPGHRTCAHRQPDHPAPTDPAARSAWISRCGRRRSRTTRAASSSRCVTEARVGDELVWEEVSTNLKRGGGSDEDAKAPENELPGPRTSPRPRCGRWRGDLGRRYGSVSGDLNPIHVHPFTARLFGFRSAIAHGMWTKARCLAALEPRLPDAFTVDVAFKKPILLPRKVEFCEADGPGPGFSVQFGVRDPAQGALAPGRPRLPTADSVRTALRRRTPPARLPEGRRRSRFRCARCARSAGR